ncbi:hypothetical protein T01_9276 [Trichinella spiralis]|uniref:Uncharacterized protein n=1 Tax=Trichinella spiralis TaxID=6334 RepID=A0A0V1C196_TRISP|nr:hypothetical protein T01_9276 [Trichinella spiralis]
MFKNPELSQDEAVEKDKNEDVDVTDKPNEDLSHSKTYYCFEVTFKWMEQPKEFSATHLTQKIS